MADETKTADGTAVADEPTEENGNKEGKLVPLGMAMDYEAAWTAEKIFRDFMQNFYDAIGAERFAEDFRYSVTDDMDGGLAVMMETEGHPFSYEWLTCIGASTKDASDGKTVGKYGEGFKVAVLQSLKNGYKGIVMESAGWRIRPCAYTQDVAGTPVGMLGYRLTEREDDGMTRLFVEGIPWRERSMLEELPLEFWHPGNPLLGEVLAGDGGHYEIRALSGEEIPGHADDGRFRGILYLNRLARGRLPFPIAVNFCGNSSLYDTRERNPLGEDRVAGIVGGCAYGMDAWASLTLLEAMEPLWGDLPKKGSTDAQWSYAVCQLARNVASDRDTAGEFKERHGNLAYLERKGQDAGRNRLIGPAGAWMKGRTDGLRIVNPVFRLLGAASVVDEYEKSLRMDYRKPDHAERERIAFLFGTLEMIINKKALYKERPEVLIPAKPSVAAGAVRTERDFSKSARRYAVRTIAVPQSVLEGDFAPALSWLISAVLGAYGRERSRRKTAKLTEAGTPLIMCREYLAEQERRWNAHA